MTLVNLIVTPTNNWFQYYNSYFKAGILCKRMSSLLFSIHYKTSWSRLY